MSTPVRRLLDNAIFEIIPMKHAEERAGAIPPGSVVSVTASPAKGMMATVELAEIVIANGSTAIPHLSARLTKSFGELESIVERLVAAEVDRVFVVGGDAKDPGDFRDAMELIDALGSMGMPFRELGVTGYPEGHPNIPDDSLDSALVAKQPHASYIATQMCFDADRIGRWVQEIRGWGVSMPVMVGIPGAIDTTKLMTIGARIGVGRSLRYLSKNRRSITKLMMPGRYQPDDLIEELAGLEDRSYIGISGLHIFTFNQVEETLSWFENARSAA